MPNVVTVCPASRATLPLATPPPNPIVIPLDRVENTRRALEIIEIAAQAGQRMLDKISIYGEAEVMRGVADTMAAAVVMIQSDA